MPCKVATEGHHGQFGAIVDAAEHGFTTKESAQGEAIETCLQLIILPDLDGVGMTEAMKAPIGVDHGGTYPGAAGGATGGGAGCNDVIKGAIDVNLEGGAAQTLLQAAADVEFLGHDDSPGIR